MNSTRSAVLRHFEKADKAGRALSAADIAHEMGFENTERARTHVRYLEWAMWIKQANLAASRAATFRITEAGRAALSEEERS